MPNRILKESICTSENIDQLSSLAEIAFYRLIVNCDDYGRMDGREKVLKSRLFPLKDIDADAMLRAVREMEDNGLITVYHVDDKPYIQMNTWGKHQQVRAKKSKYPAPNDNSCNQMISDDIKSPRNPIQSNPYPNPNPNRNPNPELDDDDARQIKHDHDRVLNAAEDAGFKMTNDVRASLIALYADSGLEKVLEGIKSCSEHGAVNLAYLRACMKGEPKKQKPKVNAQDYDQRDYQEVQDEFMKAQEERIAARLRGAS